MPQMWRCACDMAVCPIPVPVGCLTLDRQINTLWSKTDLGESNSVFYGEKRNVWESDEKARIYI